MRLDQPIPRAEADATMRMLGLQGGRDVWPVLRGIDWDWRLKPGTPRHVCDVGIIPTSTELVIIWTVDQRTLRIPIAELSVATVRFGAQAFLLVSSSTDDRHTISTHHAAAPIAAGVLRQLGAAELSVATNGRSVARSGSSAWADDYFSIYDS